MSEYGSIKLNTVKYQEDDLDKPSESNLTSIRRLHQARSVLPVCKDKVSVKVNGND